MASEQRIGRVDRCNGPPGMTSEITEPAQGEGSGQYLADRHLDVILAVSGLATITLAAPELHDIDLGSAEFALDLGHHLGTLQEWLAEAGIGSLAQGQDAVELDGALPLGQITQVYIHPVARRYLELPTAVLDDRVHHSHSIRQARLISHVAVT